MNFNRYTKRVNKIFDMAREFSSENGYDVIGSAQVLYSMMQNADGNCYNILKSIGLTKEYVLKEMSPSGNDTKQNKITMSPIMKKIIENASEIANSYHTNFVSSEHIILSILDEKECEANFLILNKGINFDVLKNMLKNEENKKENKIKQKVKNTSHSKQKSNYPYLDKYGIDLVEYAKNKNIDPLYGRDEEIKRIVQIINRRKKNNPMLVGDPGVGKTAIVEGIAKAISLMDGEKSDFFDKKMYSIEVGSLIAGTKYRGEFEERLKNIIDEISNSKIDILLFIDEIHTLVGAGNTGESGGINASDILKPALSRGSIQIIGATTRDEYRKYIEKDPALERRFQVVRINEPDRNTSIDILKGIRDKYEAYHNVKITDESIEKAVDLSIRYIGDRYLPDKAIDLIDESCSRIKLKSKFIPNNINELEKTKRNVEKKLEELILKQDYEEAIELRKQLDEIFENIKKERVRWNQRIYKDNIVTGEIVAETLETWTGIPTNKIMEDEAERLLNLENLLKEKIVGQDYAIHQVSQAIRRSRTGIQDPNRPIGSFLLVGQPGVGKTELSKTIAEVLFEGDENFIRLDMSEYMEKHSISKIIGSPPGYVGHEDGGYLTEKVRFNPYSVVLFDEIEKAHSDIMNILLQILDEGILTDSKGRIIDFKNTIIFMTSNIGSSSNKMEKNMGFSNSKVNFSETELDILDEKNKEKTLNELNTYFSKELLNRIDDIIVFRRLRKSDFEKISKILTRNLIKRAEKIGIELYIDNTVYDYIADCTYEIDQGARFVKKIIQRNITNQMSESILKKEIKSGDKVLAHYDKCIKFKII